MHEQARAARPRSASARLLIRVGVVAGIAALLLTVWRLGGFAEKQRSYRVVVPGTLISAGPYELSFTRATAQHLLKTDYRGGSWQVKVIGTGRTTGDETIKPATSGFGSAMFLARNPAADEIQAAGDATTGDGSRAGFTPGLPPVEFVLTFEFGDAFPDTDTLILAVADQEYGSNTLIQSAEDTEKTWHNADSGWRMKLPLTQLPAQQD